MASSKDLQELNDIVIPAIDSMGKKIGSFSEDIAQYRKIIMRFDEVILEKASKVSLEELQNRLNNYLTTAKHQVFENETKAYFAGVDKKLKEFHENVLQFKTESFDEVNNMMTTVLYNLRKELVESYCGHPIDEREIQARLSLKADCKEIEELKDTMVEKLEYNQTLYQLKETKRKISQVICVIMEYMSKLSLSQSLNQTHK